MIGILLPSLCSPTPILSLCSAQSFCGLRTTGWQGTFMMSTTNQVTVQMSFHQGLCVILNRDASDSMNLCNALNSPSTVLMSQGHSLSSANGKNNFLAPLRIWQDHVTAASQWVVGIPGKLGRLPCPLCGTPWKPYIGRAVPQDKQNWIPKGLDGWKSH